MATLPSVMSDVHLDLEFLSRDGKRSDGVKSVL